MRSAINFWHTSSPFDPTTVLAADFRVIAMDQRNAGRSRAPIGNEDWATYAADQLALLDHLGIERCHVMGGCIGSSYCLGIIAAAPERITAAVLQNPIGLDGGNRGEFYRIFDEWGAELAARRADVDAARLPVLRERMFGGEFVFNVSREAVRACRTPLLVLAGNDAFHPTPIAREIAALAPDAELLVRWATPDLIAGTAEHVRAFLSAHTPK